MAQILLRFDGKNVDIVEKEVETKIIDLDSRSKFAIYGKKGTYIYLSNQKDSIVLIGYTCHINNDSVQQTLSTILNTFNESQICDLKKKLVGQYVMMIKKDKNIYVFSDFIGGRNIFYSHDGLIISTSFSQLEHLLQTDSNDLERNKVFEYFCMRYILFPSWLGQSTKHKRIKWLLPYEYLTINLVDRSFKIRSIVFSIDNSKESACHKLSKDLLAILKSIIYRKEYKDSLVAVNLTGGRDTRLVAAVAADQYSNINYRIAISPKNFNTLIDFKVARKVAKIRGIQLDVYQFQPIRDEERFYEITEGFTPYYNHAITPLLDNSHTYALGFGGAFGSQLFWPIRWNSVKDFIETKLRLAKKYVFVESDFWDYLYTLLLEEFQRIKKTFLLSDVDERDYIRLFQFFYSARYSSFIMSGYNISGYQLEPYANYSVLELALRVAPEIWGNHKKLSGDALVQKMAMAILNPSMGKIITYRSFRPMIPLSTGTYPLYMIGYAKHHAHWFIKKFTSIRKKSIRTNLLNGYHISDGWDKSFIDRTVIKYGLSLSTDRIDFY